MYFDIQIISKNYAIFLQGELFKRVIQEVASKLDVNSNKILFLLNDRTIHSHDSPKSLGLQVADILCKFLIIVVIQ